MSQTKYMIIGSSHAGLSALDTIRAWDENGTVTIVSKEDALPYSPTILPYVVSGSVSPENIDLREPDYFTQSGVVFKKNAAAVSLDTKQKTVLLASGEKIQYEKLLIATGADAAIPDFPGIENVPYQVLRTLDDAQKIRSEMENAKSAIVLGAGLIAMHSAENLAQAGLEVTVVVRRHVSLFSYFDGMAAKMIEGVFCDHGIKIVTGHGVKQIAKGQNGGVAVMLQSDETLHADLLHLATGIRPRIGFLDGSGVEIDQGIPVDSFMRTNAADVWAAGDVAQAPGFFDPDQRISATIPNASIQGKIAGMDMAGARSVQPFLGGSGLNTFNFFGHHGFSVGLGTVTESTDEIEVNNVFLPSGKAYQKLVFEDNRLVGVSAINADLDPGILRELIQRRVDMGALKEKFVNSPKAVGRLLMTKLWR
jgi:phenylglyoxylate dehydrogenase epsilon subunit